MERLSTEEINKISKCWGDVGADKQVVEGFLKDMGTDVFDAFGKLCEEGKKNGWNSKTIKAILEGIDMALWD